MDAPKVDGWWQHATRLLLAPRCLICRERGHNGADMCASCTKQLPWNLTSCLRCGLPMATNGECGDCLQRPPALTQTRAVFVYGFPLDRLVPRFKFHHDLAAGRLMAELMAGPLASAPRPDAIVPVALHPHRIRQRGYDQALELARPSPPRSPCPCGPTCCIVSVRPHRNPSSMPVSASAMSPAPSGSCRTPRYPAMSPWSMT